MDIISKKNWYFSLSLLVVIPGLFAIIFWGLNRSIEFSGGSRITYSLPHSVTLNDVTRIRSDIGKEKAQIATLQISKNLVIVRTTPLDQHQHAALANDLKKDVPGAREEAFETIGPTIGAETTLNAIKAVVIASLLIILYIAWSFRRVPKPASSLRFGVCAIAALIHDVLVVLGIFAILGHFFHVEIDSLFVTALLTVIGFSVHDTIVVFDRIRENLRRTSSAVSFAAIVNDSILQTLDRSLNTSLTVLLVLLAMLLFGGETIRWFVVALLIGVTSGTYSSIFNASPLLVLWHEWSVKRKT